jgi:hypothetical protein
MSDHLSAPGGAARGGRLLAPFRWVGRRLLKPVLRRVCAPIVEICGPIILRLGYPAISRFEVGVARLQGEVTQLAERQERLDAFVCDVTAMARRLAALEDRLERWEARVVDGPALAEGPVRIPFSRSA